MTTDRFAAVRTAFATQRKKVLLDAEKSLMGSTRSALRRHGQPGWYSALVSRAQTLVRSTYRSESGQNGSDNMRAELNDFTDALTAALDKTTKPAPGDLEVRATALAASISTAAINTGMLAAALDDEAPEELRKVWLSMDDERVRPTHREADGQAVALDGKFSVGGSDLDRPGDMSAPIEEWINCRCILGVEQAQPQSRTAGADNEDVPPLVAAPDTGADMPDDTLTPPPNPLDISEGVPFHTVLAPEDVLSGDGRKFAANSLTHRNLPITLKYMKADDEGHKGSVAVAHIDAIGRKDGQMRGTGFFSMSPEADEVVGLIAEQTLNGVSIDADSAVMEMQTPEGKSVSDLLDALDDDEELELDLSSLITVFSEARISAATICAIPAFQEAFIALGEAPDDFMPTEGLVAAISEKPWNGSSSRFSDDEWYRSTILHTNGSSKVKSDNKLPIREPNGDLSRAGVHAAAGRIGQADGTPAQIGSAKSALRSAYKQLGEDPPKSLSAAVETFVPGTHDGPGWYTHPVDTKRLADYWTHGKGAVEQIQWGVPGDFNRCRTALAEWIKPNYLSGYCANRHHDALGVWPGQEGGGHGNRGHHHSGETIDAAIHLVASGTAGDKPPMEWFEDPHLTGPSPIVVTEDGRIFGHLAEWGTCHIGFDGVCIEPPPSMTDYANYRLGYVVTDGGDIPTGVITMGTGHAGPRDSARVATAHYDNTGTAVADVVAGEDEYGIWVAGRVRASATAEQIEALRGSALSGDWRDRGGHLELIAALAVNTPGFPILRPALAASGGHQTSLVAAGVVLPRRPDTRDIKAIVSEAITEHFATIERRRKMADLRQQTHLDAVSRMKALAASVEGN